MEQDIRSIQVHIYTRHEGIDRLVGEWLLLGLLLLLRGGEVVEVLLAQAEAEGQVLGGREDSNAQPRLVQRRQLDLSPGDQAHAHTSVRVRRCVRWCVRCAYCSLGTSSRSK